MNAEQDASGKNKFLIDGFPRNDENRAAFEADTGEAAQPAHHMSPPSNNAVPFVVLTTSCMFLLISYIQPSSPLRGMLTRGLLVCNCDLLHVLLMHSLVFLPPFAEANNRWSSLVQI